MIKRYLITKHYGASEFRAVGEPFCDKILFRRDGVVTEDGKDVIWTPLHEIGGEIPAAAHLIGTEVETF